MHNIYSYYYNTFMQFFGYKHNLNLSEAENLIHLFEIYYICRKWKYTPNDANVACEL